MNRQQQRSIQISTTYHHSSGQRRMRVTTLVYPWLSNNMMSDLIAGFDQVTFFFQNDILQLFYSVCGFIYGMFF